MITHEQVKGLKVGDEIVGDKVTIKRVGRSDYFLRLASAPRGRARWGRLSQICEDLDHVTTHGSLPAPAMPRW